MGIAARDSGNVLRAISGLKMRDATNTLRTIQTIKMRDSGNVLRVVYTAMSANASPADVSGTYGSFSGSHSVVSNSTTAIITGGVAAYTYAWSYVSGDSGIAANSASAATTTFSKTLAVGTETSAVFQCLVTDANGATATCFVTVTLNHVDLS